MRNSRIFVCLSALALLTSDGLSQNASVVNATTGTTREESVVEVETIAPDLLVMSAGSILVVRGNQKSRLETELRLTDGSVLTPGGTVRRPDGSSTSLADGQSVTANGKIGTAPAGSLTETTSTGVEIVPVK
jgi:hypothetical protein